VGRLLKSTMGHKLRAFVSHSAFDKSFAERVADVLRTAAINPWIDKEQVLVGDDVLEKLGEGLRTMDLLVFILRQGSSRVCSALPPTATM